MDALFTTFLSPGMASPCWPLEGMTTRKNFSVELDLTRSLSNEDDILKYHSDIAGGDDLAKQSSNEGNFEIIILFYVCACTHMVNIIRHHNISTHCCKRVLMHDNKCLLVVL